MGSTVQIVTVDGPLRAALLAAWNEGCAWCGRWIAITETEIDHIVPQGVPVEERTEILRLHGLPSNYDVHATRNLVPACQRCNRFKGSKPPPNVPIVAFVLAKANAVAVSVDDQAARLRKDRSLDRALALINAQYPNAGITRDVLDELNQATMRAEAVIAEVTGVSVPVHPALGGLFNAASWRVVGEASGVVTVTDGQRVGYTGGSEIMVCGHCGSRGPWNGPRCLTCGWLDDGD